MKSSTCNQYTQTYIDLSFTLNFLHRDYIFMRLWAKVLYHQTSNDLQSNNFEATNQ